MKWDEVRPVLKATYRLLNDAESTSPEAVCVALGRRDDDERIRRALALLHQEGYIGGFTTAQTPVPISITPT